MRTPIPSSVELLRQLSRNSTPYQDPLTRVNWAALRNDQFWLPETAVSLHGLPEYSALPADRRRTLSQYEFLNFISAGLWLEGMFVERIARALRSGRHTVVEHAYLLHELREEAGHSLMFLELMRRTTLPVPRARFTRLDVANLMGRHAPFDSLLFWIAVLIGEEVPDRMNRYLRKRRDEICPAIFDMITLHTMDEARHIAHARDVVQRRLQTLKPWQARLLAPLLRAAFRRFVQIFYFPRPEVYELAGVGPGRHWALKARANPQRAAFVDECVSSTLGGLREHGIDLDWRG